LTGPDIVCFAGAVPAEALPRYYAASDIFLLPNRIDAGDVEGFGIVFLEAAASALPTVGGNNGGVPEAVEDGTTGYLVDGANVNAVVEGLTRLVANAETRHQLGVAGRQRVLREFTWERAAEKVAAVHASLQRGRRHDESPEAATC
jgi:phosphatidylinositol alpha-1,6-mannosyltransferase